jgi:hypothetical protein
LLRFLHRPEIAKLDHPLAPRVGLIMPTIYIVLTFVGGFFIIASAIYSLYRIGRAQEDDAHR